MTFRGISKPHQEIHTVLSASVLSLSYFPDKFFFCVSSSLHYSAGWLCLGQLYLTDNTVFTMKAICVNVLRSHACYFCAILKELEFYQHIFLKIVSVKFYENQVVPC